MTLFLRQLFVLCIALLASVGATAQPSVPISVPTEVPTASIWLLGEVHDNPDAHRARFQLIEAQVKAGWRPAIAMEQFDREHQGLLRTAQRQGSAEQGRRRAAHHTRSLILMAILITNKPLLKPTK